MFSITSRYQGLPTATLDMGDGRKVTYVRRRFVPRPEDLRQTGEHVLKPGERLDSVAFAELGDAELSWRIADANRATNPEDLQTPGRRLRVTLPAQITQAGGLIGLPGGGANA